MPTQLQALVNGSIQVAILSPPMVIVARDEYKMTILASAMEEFSSLQNGLGVLERNVKHPVVKRMLRARAKANRYFHQHEKGTAEVLAKYLNIDLNTRSRLTVFPKARLLQTAFRAIVNCPSISKTMHRFSACRHRYRWAGCLILPCSAK